MTYARSILFCPVHDKLLHILQSRPFAPPNYTGLESGHDATRLARSLLRILRWTGKGTGMQSTILDWISLVIQIHYPSQRPTIYSILLLSIIHIVIFRKPDIIPGLRRGEKNQHSHSRPVRLIHNSYAYAHIIRQTTKSSLM
jgi:hypothetical protein